MKKDYIDFSIKSYYIANKDYDLEKIKSHLAKEKIIIEEKVLAKRIEKIKNEN